MVSVRQHLSLEAFLGLPDEEPALEYDDGVVTQKVSPQGKHSLLQTKLCEFINALFESRQLALALSELRTTFGGSSRVPDISVFRWDRIPTDEHGEIANECWIPPDLAIEILSPDQATNQVTTKCRRMVEDGVEIALLVNPLARTVTLFRSRQVPTTVRGNEILYLESVLPGMRLTPNDIFRVLTIKRGPVI